MNFSFSRRATGTALAVAAAFAMASARAELVVLGSDYFMTIQPTSFVPLGTSNPLAGLPIGPGKTDTIVQRQADCSLSLSSPGSACTIPIEMVALSLVSTVNPNMRVRESPTLASVGTMKMISDGSGTGGTFDSFFDVFFEISIDGGATWQPQGDLTLDSSGTAWTTIEPTSPYFLFVDGLVGNQSANRHTNKGAGEVDFYVGIVIETHPGAGVHTAQSATIPEPGTLALTGLAFAALGALGRRARRAAGSAVA